MHQIRAVALIALLVSGCAGWHQVTTSPPPKLDRREVLAFDTGTQHVKLHAVRFTVDSLSGVPWLQPPGCDSCRVSYPLSEVKNAEAGHPERDFWATLSPIFAFFAIGIFLAIGFRSNYP